MPAGPGAEVRDVGAVSRRRRLWWGWRRLHGRALGGTSMNKLLNSLTDAERMLVHETERAQLAELDEDGLVALHTRIRRARDKYTSSYRREASASIAEHGGRGKAFPKNTRNRQKAEVFEDALARVSRNLASAARRSAQQLRSERIEAARRERASGPARGRRSSAAPAPMTSQRPRKLPASRPDVRKQHAGTRAVGARRQARRDSRRSGRGDAR